MHEDMCMQMHNTICLYGKYYCVSWGGFVSLYLIIWWYLMHTCITQERIISPMLFRSITLKLGIFLLNMFQLALVCLNIIAIPYDPSVVYPHHMWPAMVVNPCWKQPEWIISFNLHSAFYSQGLTETWPWINIHINTCMWNIIIHPY